MQTQRFVKTKIKGSVPPPPLLFMVERALCPSFYVTTPGAHATAALCIQADVHMTLTHPPH